MIPCLGTLLMLLFPRPNGYPLSQQLSWRALHDSEAVPQGMPVVRGGVLARAPHPEGCLICGRRERKLYRGTCRSAEGRARDIDIGQPAM